MKISAIWVSIFFIFCAGCQSVVSTATLQEPSALQATPIPTETVSQADQEAWKDWEAGPHAAAYDLGKGPNTYCARCHSPKNWDVDATIDPPPNCVSCKFASEESVRIAVGNPLISVDDWKGIGCEDCHRVKNGVVSSEIGWYSQQTGYYETVTSANELCEKCHTDTKTLKHKMDLGDGVHSGYTCTQCHQPHSVAASCLSAGCHPDVTFLEEQTSEHVGHNVSHKSIDCIACHDATGLQVDKSEEQGIWTIYRTSMLLGRETTAAYVSHNLTKEVNCERCHFADNPWMILDAVLEK